MADDRTRRLLEFMLDRRSYEHRPSRVAMIETHISWVFIASPFAFKIRKPVQYDFLDFSTLDLRLADCRREIQLNQPLAPALYLDVVPIHESVEGLAFDGPGIIVEWAVKMKELDPRYFMSSLIKETRLTTRDLDPLIKLIAASYARTTPLSPLESSSANACVRSSVHENFHSLRCFRSGTISDLAVDATETFSVEFEQRREALFASRICMGFFRNCHGDLRLEHVHLRPESVLIFDCIEFNDALRRIDVASDLAFLAMDLDFNGRRDLSKYFVDQFAASCGGGGFLDLVDYYKCYRACVRGKVACIGIGSMALTGANAHAALSAARRYLMISLGYALSGSRPQVFVLMGRVASGKSSLADGLSGETGWQIVSSDTIRKQRAGVPLCHRGTPEERSMLYEGRATSETYDDMCRQTLENLERGTSVIVDATFARRDHRAKLTELVHRAGYRLAWIEVQVSASQALERLKNRELRADVISDARVEDFEILNHAFEEPNELPPAELVRLRTEGDAGSSLQNLLRCLAVRQANGGRFLHKTV